jgi:hypothetical protein
MINRYLRIFGISVSCIVVFMASVGCNPASSKTTTSTPAITSVTTSATPTSTITTLSTTYQKAGWTLFPSGNQINGLITKGNEIWAATSGGVKDGTRQLAVAAFTPFRMGCRVIISIQ